MIQLSPTESVRQIAARIEDAGFEAWCVGGAIRDAMLGHEALDWDIATPATPQAIQGIFGHRRTIPVGIEFGTVAVLDDAGVAHEITTFRRDVKTDGRHAEVEFGVSLEDDLARRDLTINAMAYRPRTDEMRDPFDGRFDIKRRVVRAVGDPELRMKEDRLRALRAIRFAARYDFAIEPATLRAIEGSAPYLDRLSAERVQQELVKTMEQVEHPATAIVLWRDTGILRALIPALADMSEVALATLNELPREHPSVASAGQRTVNRIAALFMDLGADVARTTMTALRFSKADVQWATAVLRLWSSLSEGIAQVLIAGEPTDEQIRRWLSVIGRMNSHGFLRLAAARWHAMALAGQWAPTPGAVRLLHRRMTGARLNVPIEVADLAIGGDELRAAGIPPGPLYAKILHALLDRVLANPALNTPSVLHAELPAVIAAISQGDPR